MVEADTGYFLKTPSSALFLLKNDTDHVIYPQLSKLIMPKNSIVREAHLGHELCKRKDFNVETKQAWCARWLA